jgi:methylated-DNA-[protein]-cysteine S-methyltransferase
MIQYRTIDSPIGTLTLAGRGRVLTNLRMVDQTYWRVPVTESTRI